MRIKTGELSLLQSSAAKTCSTDDELVGKGQRGHSLTAGRNGNPAEPVRGAVQQLLTKPSI